MSPLHPTSEITGSPAAAGQAPVLHSEVPGRWLVLARVAWVMWAVGVLGLFVASIPAQYHALTDPIAGIPEFTTLGLSRGAYALYHVVRDTIFVLVFALIAIIIFWRKSAERLALLGAFMLVTWGVAFANSPGRSVALIPSGGFLSQP